MERSKAIKILKGELCPYCLKPPNLIDSKEVYGTSYGLMWRCDDCDAHVGVHEGTETPLGRLANKELREWKMKAHKAFDPLWKRTKTDRKYAYKWLAIKLGILPEFCHIGMFSIEYCKRTIDICQNEKPPKNENL